MHQQEPSAPALPHWNAVPQRSQTRLRNGSLWTAGAGLMVLLMPCGTILPCRRGGFKNACKARA